MEKQSNNEAKTKVNGQTYSYWMDFATWCMYARNKAGQVCMISRSSYLKDEVSVQYAIAEAFGLENTSK